MNKNLRLFLLVTMAAATAACSGARARKSDQAAKDKAAQEAAGAGVVPDVNVQEASLRGKDFQAIEGLATIRFDYDSASLKPVQLDALKKNADYLKKNPGLEVLVAGHCDERGTTEYNLALGQKRAKEVRDYYIRLGVNGRSVATISYGKESPACSESTESCWAENRRAETRIRMRVSDNGPKKSAQ